MAGLYTTGGLQNKFWENVVLAVDYSISIQYIHIINLILHIYEYYMYIKGSQIPKEKQFIGKTTNVPQFSQMHHNRRIKKNRALFRSL